MPLHAIEPRRLYRQIADQIRALIASGEYPAGSRLPAERDLAQQLGVSRPSVREALIALEVEGLVDVRVGSGVHVTGTAAESPARSVDNAYGPFEIIRARQIVEGELAALAARRFTRALGQALEDALAGMEADIAAGRMPIDGDRRFHITIAEAAANGPLVRTVTELYDERNNPLFEHFGQHFEDAHSWSKAVAEHRRVVQAIAARDAEGARRAMQRHLELSQKRFAEIAVDAHPAPHPAPRPGAAR